MNEYKPIKRSKAFIAFSKDHHFSLLLTWKIRQDIASNVNGEHISNYVRGFFNDNLRQHFKEEEELIFSRLAANDVLRKQAEDEHKKIVQIVKSLSKNYNDNNLLKQFADLLEAHVRFEERILFNHLQEVLMPEELDEIFLSMEAHDDAGKRSKLFAAKHV
jgi:hypothetical protein